MLITSEKNHMHCALQLFSVHNGITWGASDSYSNTALLVPVQ